ncbi:uncharacterized protein LOC112884881 isoform X2 [Panicum hallii]|uniref:uncharacterized protein LOC112884881 isoform X2 n=1 Tax=Panicum hallii TaxID=206008 RepID=UPI000DF4EFEE|nr:uncharacterized protein LOC112884881 isoform X2 [Panicum hallii]
MSEGQSQRSVASSVRHRQEAELAAAEERERAAAETVATTARASRLAADAARAEAVKLKALRGSSISSSASIDGSTDVELKLAREAADGAVGSRAPPRARWRQSRRAWMSRRRSWQGRAQRPRSWQGRAQRPRSRWWQPRLAWTRRRHSWRRRPRSWRRRPGRRRSRPLQAARLSLPGPVPWSPRDSGCCQGRWPRRWVAYPHQDQLCRVGRGNEVPPKMQFSLSKKRTDKEAWDAIAAAHIGSDRARKSTLQELRKEWENLAFKPGEDVDDFAFCLNTLLQKMVQYGDDTYDEERAIEKLFRYVPEKYKQIARSIESLLDLSTMSIE